MDLAALQAKAAASNPMGSGVAPILQGRTIYQDGDGLAYYCAGNDETTVAEARARLRDKVNSMGDISRAAQGMILLTGSGGHKGHRYAVARVKPYQGQRVSSKRPKNWLALRQLLEVGEFGPVTLDFDREADDRFGQYGWANPEGTVISTQDKDMRMVPGFHMDWKDNRMFYLAPGTYSEYFNDKLYGEAWFWHQMLMGDTADNIPGLPMAFGKRIGEVTTFKYLSSATNGEQAFNLVYQAYASHYGDRALTEMGEQAVLLWMRASPDAHWAESLNAVGVVGKHCWNTLQHQKMWAELEARVTQAQELNALQTDNV